MKCNFKNVNTAKYENNKQLTVCGNVALSKFYITIKV